MRSPVGGANVTPRCPVWRGTQSLSTPTDRRKNYRHRAAGQRNMSTRNNIEEHQPSRRNTKTIYHGCRVVMVKGAESPRSAEVCKFYQSRFHGRGGLPGFNPRWKNLDDIRRRTVDRHDSISQIENDFKQVDNR